MVYLFFVSSMSMISINISKKNKINFAVFIRLITLNCPIKSKWFCFQVESLQGSSDFFGFNHYTTFLMSPSQMEDEWKVPSMDHDTGVRMEQHPAWPKPGAPWFTVGKSTFRIRSDWSAHFGPASM